MALVNPDSNFKSSFYSTTNGILDLYSAFGSVVVVLIASRYGGRTLEVVSLSQ